MALILCFPLFAMANVSEVMYWVIGKLGKINTSLLEDNSGEERASPIFN